MFIGTVGVGTASFTRRRGASRQIATGCVTRVRRNGSRKTDASLDPYASHGLRVSLLGPLAAVAEDGRRLRADAAHEPDVVQARSGAVIPPPRASAPPPSIDVVLVIYLVSLRRDARGPPSRAFCLFCLKFVMRSLVNIPRQMVDTVLRGRGSGASARLAT